MNTFHYTPTYTNKRTLDKVPEEVVKMFGENSNDQIEKMIPTEVIAKAREITQQRQQAIFMREYLAKQQGVQKSKFI